MQRQLTQEQLQLGDTQHGQKQWRYNICKINKSIRYLKMILLVRHNTDTAS